MNQTYRIVALAPAISEAVRETLRAPGYGHPAYVELAQSYGPCRSCLATFRQGEEERILFTYNPFANSDGLPAPGPIFIHRDSCTPYLGTRFPDGLRHLDLFLEGYGDHGWRVQRMRVVAGDVESPLAKLLADPGIEFVDVRNAKAGCFIARIER